MLSTKDLKPDQAAAVTQVYENDGTYLIGGMGAGKTVVAATAAAELLRDGVVKRILVVSTINITKDVWPNELMKWDQLDRLNYCALTGKGAGKRHECLNAKDLARDTHRFNIFGINFESLPTLIREHGLDSFDMLIIDEVTKMAAGGVAFKRLRRYIPDFKVRLVMTGTPVSEGWIKIFYPMMIVDNGARLGKNKQEWLDTYFYATDFEQRNWEILPALAKDLADCLNDVMFVMDSYDHLLPDLTTEQVPTPFTDTRQQKVYDSMMYNMVLEGVEAVNAAVKVGKLQQLAGSWMYNAEGEVVDYGSHKASYMAALAGVARVENEQIVWVYQYQHELALLKQNVARYVIMGETVDALALFRGGYAHNLFIHPKSAGHGIDLSCAHRMIFVSPLWSRDQTRQTIARVWRQGQEKPCTVLTFVTTDTIEEEIVSREEGKASHHELLLASLAKAKL